MQYVFTRFYNRRVTPRYISSIRHSLLRYFINIDDAIEDRHIKDDAMMVKLAKSNLAGRVKTWLSELKFHGLYFFHRKKSIEAAYLDV